MVIKMTNAILQFLFVIFLIIGTVSFALNIERYYRQRNTVSVVVVTDDDTGCQYLYGGGFGITPRVNALGNHICDEVKK